MKTKDITICGKPVTLAYCYATEIGFCDIAETGIENIDTTNPKHVIALIMAAILAYYECKKEECPIKDSYIMYDADPSEITNAFVAIMELRLAWYKLPAVEQKNDADVPEASPAAVSEASPSDNEDSEKND